MVARQGHFLQPMRAHRFQHVFAGDLALDLETCKTGSQHSKRVICVFCLLSLSLYTYIYIYNRVADQTSRGRVRGVPLLGPALFFRGLNLLTHLEASGGSPGHFRTAFWVLGGRLGSLFGTIFGTKKGCVGILDF